MVNMFVLNGEDRGSNHGRIKAKTRKMVFAFQCLINVYVYKLQIITKLVLETI